MEEAHQALHDIEASAALKQIAAKVARDVVQEIDGMAVVGPYEIPIDPAEPDQLIAAGITLLKSGIYRKVLLAQPRSDEPAPTGNLRQEAIEHLHEKWPALVDRADLVAWMLSSHPEMTAAAAGDVIASLQSAGWVRITPADQVQLTEKSL